MARKDMAIAARRRLSRRAFLRAAAQGLAALAALSGCGAPNDEEIPTAPPARSSTPPPTASPTPPPAPTAPPTASLEARIGQMLLVGFRGPAVTPSDTIVRDIAERHLGGVVLFDYDVPSGRPLRNVQSPEQLQALVATLHEAAEEPLLVAVDQEGGHVSRLNERHGFPATMPAEHLGRLGDLQVTHDQAGSMAATLAGMGINLNLAPVVDLRLNPENPIIARYERAFSADPEVVAAQALAFIAAHHEQGVLTTLKHFPGHGSSQGDSHLGLVDVTHTWSRVELEPYARIIAAGAADAVMTAHVFNANLDPECPATLSPATITGLLRGELGYDGVVISDDMQMGAIAQQYGFEEAIRRAIAAGVDILAFSNNLAYDEAIATRAVAAIVGLVRSGAISEARIGESYQRIRRLKSRLRAG
ncbi:MAG TPA: glycoside hydrolase family 3 N-terminal domain-containing protein [Anaerolineae bacterium]|nr:glycoside hydrolase family 3 N-terminal domain-containing protein [Anaerolineae bacterium]HPL27154.1 glycoside hydrolase family 3 N-terminal domain-containing protein [Anaerolineae bacterium]